VGFDPAPHRDPRGNERWIVLGAFVFGLVALVAIVLEDYEPAKLAPVFMLLAWFPLIALHELGHALVAKLLGWEVREMVVGFGAEIARFELRGVPVTLKMYPLAGWVVPVPRTLRGVRWRSALVYLAGPLSELALVAVLGSVVGWETMLSRSDAVAVIAAQGVCIAALIDVVSNLIPRAVQTEHGWSYTDGLGAIRALTKPRAEYAAQVRSVHEEAILDALAGRDVEGTLDACEKAYAALGDDPHLRSTMGAALTELRRETPLDLDGRALPDAVRRRASEAPPPATSTRDFDQD